MHYESLLPCIYIYMLCRASDKCQREKRKTINGDDLLWAMDVLFFKEYLQPLTLYLQKFREAEKHEHKSQGHKASTQAESAKGD